VVNANAGRNEMKQKIDLGHSVGKECRGSARSRKIESAHIRHEARAEKFYRHRDGRKGMRRKKKQTSRNDAFAAIAVTGKNMPKQLPRD